MTPKEKAQDLYNKMDNQRQISSDAAKQCALIAVNEIIKITWKKESWYSPRGGYEERYLLDPYWEQVKKEIEAL